MAQANASAPLPMTPQQRLAILLQPQSPSEVLLSQSPHQKGVNWVFHNQATGQIRYVNVPYTDITGQQSAPQPTMTQQTPNWMSQQAQQMQSAGQPMNRVAQQLAMMTNAASTASPQ